MRGIIKIWGSKQDLWSEQFRPEDGQIKEIFTYFLILLFRVHAIFRELLSFSMGE